MEVNEELKFFVLKENFLRGGGAGQGECERRFEVFVKCKKWGGGLGRGVDFFFLGGGGGVRVDK